jgi:hypothetical protein
MSDTTNERVEVRVMVTYTRSMPLITVSDIRSTILQDMAMMAMITLF